MPSLLYITSSIFFLVAPSISHLFSFTSWKRKPLTRVFKTQLHQKIGVEIKTISICIHWREMKEIGGRKQGTSLSPCAACKLLRRRCAQDCVFAPYFPADEPHKFASVHKVFGASNVNKMLQVSNSNYVFLYYKLFLI